MDSNYSVDEIYGTVEFDIGSVLPEQPIVKTFSFNEVLPPSIVINCLS